MEKNDNEAVRSAKLKILIADDHPVVIEGIIKALEKEPDFEVVGTASDGLQAVSQVKTLKPDIVIMDISMPNLRGIDATHEIKKSREQTHVMIYTMYSEREYVISLFRIGISAYILKREPIKELVRAIKVVARGGTYFTNGVRKILQHQLDSLIMGDLSEVREVENGIKKLSIREKEIFILLADGLRVKEIAERLCISPKTVETHKYNIMDKLQAPTLPILTKIAIKKNLIDV